MQATIKTTSQPSKLETWQTYRWKEN